MLYAKYSGLKIEMDRVLIPRPENCECYDVSALELELLLKQLTQARTVADIIRVRTALAALRQKYLVAIASGKR